LSSNPRIPYRLATSPATLPPLRGKRLIVQLVVNIENWQFDQAMPRTILTPPHGRDQVPDVPNFSWAEYGMRRGMPRLLELFRTRQVPAGASINSGVIEAYAECAEAILKAGWEWIGHGIHQKAIHGESDERGLIESAMAQIAKFTGAPPRGWLGPGLRESAATPDHLRAAGIDYVFDWVLDDLPCWMTTTTGPLLSMPYTLEINDSVIYAVERHATGEMQSRFERTLRTFDRELNAEPRILTLGLHPHLIAVPHRFGELEFMLDTLLARDDVVFVKSAEIADWFSAASPPP
jgi:allantoinase